VFKAFGWVLGMRYTLGMGYVCIGYLDEGNEECDEILLHDESSS
jgi:hypothetical protein